MFPVLLAEEDCSIKKNGESSENLAQIVHRKGLFQDEKKKSVYLEDRAQLAYLITVQIRIRKYYQPLITLRAAVRGTQRLFPPKYIENTFQAIQGNFRSLEMHSKQRYKIYICSVILGELESFQNYKGFRISPIILDLI